MEGDDVVNFPYMNLSSVVVIWPVRQQHKVTDGSCKQDIYDVLIPVR